MMKQDVVKVGKRTIRQNIYGNWNGYVGRKLVWHFGFAEWDAQEWVKTGADLETFLGYRA